MTEIIERVKSILDIRDETDLTEIDMYKLLEKKRNKYHPDNTTNEDVKEKYEEKFKEITTLLKEFGDSIAQKPVKTSNELAIYERNYSIIESKQKVLELQELIDNLKKEKDLFRFEIESLKKEISRLQDKNAEEETKKLLELYKPKRVNIYAVGLIAILGIFFNLLLQVEKVANLFAKYAPFLNEISITYVTLTLLLIFSGILFRKYLQEKMVDNWSKKVSLTFFQKKLFEDEWFRRESEDYSYYRRERERDNYGDDYHYHERNERLMFKESEIVHFLQREFLPKGRLKRFYQNQLLNLDKGVIIDNLKNIIIYNLMNRELIQAAGNEGFEKVFKIKHKRY